MQLTDVYMTTDKKKQGAGLDQADMYLAEAGKLDCNPPGPLKPCSGWISEVCKVRVSWCCCLFFIMLCVLREGSRPEVNLTLIVQ